MTSKSIAFLRYITTGVLLITVFVSTSMLTLAAEKKIAGEIIVSAGGNNPDKPAVLLDGARVLSGQTFFSTGVISTSETGSAIVNLGKLGHIKLSAGSALSLNLTENNISGNLSAGQIKIFSNKGVAVNIKTVDGIVNNNANQKGVYTIDVSSGTIKTAIQEGSISLNNGTTNTPLQSGQQSDDDDDDDNDYLVPLLVVAGIAAVVTIILVANNDDDDEVTSPVR